jgi:hypothetical protein
MSKTDEFTNQSLKQQAKLLGALESATNSYISAVKRRDAAQKQSAANIKSQNPTMTQEQINAQIIEQAHGKALEMNKKFDAKKLADEQKLANQIADGRQKLADKKQLIAQRELRNAQKIEQQRIANEQKAENQIISQREKAEQKAKQVYKRLTYRNNYRPRPKYRRFRTKKHKKHFGKTKKYRR